jgi:RimK family alpha-L-glutamate ligase
VGILVLSARPDTASNRRLVEAAAAANAELELVDATTLVAGTDGQLGLRSNGAFAGRFGVVLARVGNWRPESLLALLEAAVAGGAATPNPASGIRIGRDHWRTAQRLAEAGLPVPETLAGADPEELAAAVGRRLSFPVVVKQRRSRMGVGVIRCHSMDHLEAVLDSLWRVGDEVIVQQHIETGGTSLRLLVVGGRVVAAARFAARSGEWRSNAARGGLATAFEAEPAVTDLALEATRVIGLGICGVDLLPGVDGPVVGEVNPTPGFTSLEAATGADVASAIVDHLVALGC